MPLLKNKNPMKAVIKFLLLLCPLHQWAQPYVEGGNTRHRFAQMNLGADTRFFSPNGTAATHVIAGETKTYTPVSPIESRLIIGGTHFWGHADFFVAFPIALLQAGNFSSGVETGARYFPWRIQHHRFSPFIGASFGISDYKQANGANLTQVEYPLTTGFYFNHKNHLFEISAGYRPQSQLNYYHALSESATHFTPRFYFAFGYKFMIETTISAEKDWQSGKTKRLTDTLSKLNRLNGFFCSMGPSSVFFHHPSSYNAANLPFIGEHKIGVFPEFGMGYYWHRPDLFLNLAYRQFKNTIKAFDYKQTVNRKALTIDACKFLFDYHGFVPFLGVNLSYENNTIQNTTPANETKTHNNKGLEPGLTFGWDIRPNRLQAIYLRTTLRYYPTLKVKIEQQNFLLKQLEFNFIQVVVFPGRFM